MSKTTTPRVLLIKESDDELIDSFSYNWPLIDAAVGAKKVAAGVTPPNSELFDGCIVSEATTGKSWIARTDGVGGYTKKWLTYPYQIYGTAATLSVGSGTTPLLFGSLGYQAAQSINASAADIVGGQIVVPVDGIYELDLSVRWSSSAVANSYRVAALAFNSVTTQAEHNKSEDLTPVSNSSTIVQSNSSLFKKLVAGTTIASTVWQNTGLTLTIDLYIRASLVAPL